MPGKAPKKKPTARRARQKATPVPQGLVTVTRQVHFSAAHRLHNPAFSQEWNERHYGQCTNPHGHGHNYVLEVTVSGRPDADTGYVLDLAELKRILHRMVVDRCDHRNLNEEVDFLRGINPSTENLVIAFWNEIEPHIPAGNLHRVRLYETPRNFADYYGPGRSEA